MHKPNSLKKILVAFFLFTPFAPAISRAGSVGDRLILSINAVPYTQRQAELYLNVKEALKAGPSQPVNVITEQNWRDALKVFTEDMVVLQEAARLGSFAAPDELTEKYLTTLKSRLASGSAFSERAKILGLVDSSIGPVLDHVLRVAAFRRSKERGENGQQSKAATSKWLDDLMSRQTVRKFDDALEFVEIHPARDSGG